MVGRLTVVGAGDVMQDPAPGRAGEFLCNEAVKNAGQVDQCLNDALVAFAKNFGQLIKVFGRMDIGWHRSAIEVGMARRIEHVRE